MNVLPEESFLSSIRATFKMGSDRFSDLEIRPTSNDKFYYFWNRATSHLVKDFILASKQRTDYVCKVVLIKKNDKFSPRLTFSVRDASQKILTLDGSTSSLERNVKANVSLSDCHENFWDLISFIQSIPDIDPITSRTFSLVSNDEAAVVRALGDREVESKKIIIRLLSQDVIFSHEDLNLMLKRRDVLRGFEEALATHPDQEPWWQNFFETNKWIFGYGLDYRILKQEQSQPDYGGTGVNGSGAERGDYLTSTGGDARFIVLVEIKTPATKLLHGTDEIRNGAWSLSRPLTDALSQISANIHTWEKEGSRKDVNQDRFDKNGVYTVRPKGIIVVGSLGEVKDVRTKRETFERFRASIHGVEIVTFDELYCRAKFIVDSQDAS